MKTNKNLKKITLILIIIVLSFISLIGIFIKKTNQYENILPKYKYGMQFNGSRVLNLKVDLSEEEIEVESETTEEDEDEEKEPETELVPVNAQEALTEANYKKAKDIMEKRLKALSVQEYIIRQDKENGNMVIEIPENEDTDEIVSILATTGKFEMIDADTKEVLLNNTDIKSSNVLYNSGTDGTTVYLGITFNKEGKKKLAEISKTYVKSEDEEGNETTKNVTMQIDEQEIVTTYFGDTIETGEITLPMKDGITDTKTLQEYAQNASQIAVIIDNGNFPIVYTLDDNKYVMPEENNIINNIKIVAAIVFCLGVIYFVIRYKENGLIASFLELGFISVLLLLIRYTNTVLTMNGIVAAFIISAISYYYLATLLKELKENQNSKQVFNTNLKKTAIHLIPVLIIAIVFTLQSAIELNSFGIVLFWGLVALFVYLVWLAKLMLVNLGGRNEK